MLLTNGNQTCYCMFRNNQPTHQFLSIYYFTLPLLHVSATVCLSSGSSSVPSEFHANLDFWLINFCVVCGCVLFSSLVRIDLSMPPCNTHTQPHTARNFINKNPKLACSSEGTGELPEDGTRLPKHVGTAK
jgi:hypothetical protein